MAECDGYTYAFANALALYGIQSFAVFGTVIGAGGHAWNLVRIDGKYYHTDLTWNDDTEYTDKDIFYYNRNNSS